MKSVLVFTLFAFATPALAASPSAAEVHYQKSLKLAQARNEGRACEVEAYAGDVLRELSEAVRLDASYRGKAKVSASLQRAMRSNLAFQMLVENVQAAKAAAKTELMKGLLGRGVVVYGAPRGVWGSGSQLAFKANAQVTFQELDEDHTVDAPKYLTKEGVYLVSLLNDQLIIEVLFSGGDDRMYSVSIEQDAAYLNEGKSSATLGSPVFSSNPSECST